MYTHIIENIKAHREYIRRCARVCGRQDAVRLVAVAKTKPAEFIRAAYQAGQRDFGENYVQEARAKMESLSDLPLIWHFIGRVQSNKTRLLARYFDWVQSVASMKEARRLSDQRPDLRPPLNVCIQVNINRSEGRAGCPPEEAASLAMAMLELPRLSVRGLMAIPAYERDSLRHRRQFAELAALYASIKKRTGSAEWNILSMGMSGDMESAIREGATMVRLGTALFGPRLP